MRGERKLIYDLFGGTGAWSQFYYDNPREYEVIIVDPRAKRSPKDLRMTIQDFRKLIKRGRYLPHGRRPYGILGAFPCKQFALSGSRWWAGKDQDQPWLIQGAIDNVNCLLDCVDWLVPEEFFCAENPVGRAPQMVPRLGRWKMTFNPHEYGAWFNPPIDAYTKRTCLYGEFQFPIKKPVAPTEGSKLWKLSPGPEREFLRSITPKGFSKAFYEANR